MKRYVSYLVCLIGMFIVSSCLDKDDTNCGGKFPVDENGEVTRTFTLLLPSPVNSTSTYGMTYDDENAILTLDILAFKINGNVQNFAYHVQATDVEDDTNDSRYKVVTVKLKVSDDRFNLVFLANVSDEIAALGDISNIGEKDKVVERLIHEHGSGQPWDMGKYFPMWGESGSVVIDEQTGVDETVQMLRAVARIDILTDEEKVDNFILEEAYLYQYNDMGHVVPDPENIIFNVDKYTATAPTIPAGVSAVKCSDKYIATSKAITNEIYTYESLKSIVHLEKTCLVLGGRYYPKDYQTGNPEPNITYYRVDFVNRAKEDIALLRNHRYIMTIQKVAGEGYTDPDEAYEAKPFNIDVDVLEWDDGDIRDFVYNNQYFLGVSESEIFMPKPAADTSIIITTSYPGGWTPTFELENVNESDWLTYKEGLFTGPGEKDKLVFHLTQNNEGIKRTGLIHLRAGVLRHTIKVHQSIEEEDSTDVIWLDDKGEANCYILSPSGNGIRIPVSQANKDGVKRIKDSDILEAEVLWTDTEAAVGTDGCVIRSAKIAQTENGKVIEVIANKVWGNAVVAVKVNNKIRWSWHIWVLEYQPEETAINYNKGGYNITFLDRNLGALSADAGESLSIGLLYQWGRKDPFPGLDGFNTNNLATKRYNSEGYLIVEASPQLANQESMLEFSIEHPLIHIEGSSTYGDWMGNAWNSGNNDLWKMSGGEASPYDPCPAGWNMDIEIGFWQNMSSSIFQNTYSSTDKGSNTEDIGFWPAGGFLNNDGSFNTTDLGKVGYYWTGEENWGYSYALKVGDIGGGYDVGQTPPRSRGLSVRCQKNK